MRGCNKSLSSQTFIPIKHLELTGGGVSLQTVLVPWLVTGTSATAGSSLM